MIPVLTGCFTVLRQRVAPFRAVDNFVGDDVEDHIVFFYTSNDLWWVEGGFGVPYRVWITIVSVSFTIPRGAYVQRFSEANSERKLYRCMQKGHVIPLAAPCIGRKQVTNKCGEAFVPLLNGTHDGGGSGWCVGRPSPVERW